MLSWLTQQSTVNGRKHRRRSRKARAPGWESPLLRRSWARWPVRLQTQARLRSTGGWQGQGGWGHRGVCARCGAAARRRGSALHRLQASPRPSSCTPPPACPQDVFKRKGTQTHSEGPFSPSHPWPPTHPLPRAPPPRWTAPPCSPAGRPPRAACRSPARSRARPAWERDRVGHGCHAQWGGGGRGVGCTWVRAAAASQRSGTMRKRHRSIQPLVQSHVSRAAALAKPLLLGPTFSEPSPAGATRACPACPPRGTSA